MVSPDTLSIKSTPSGATIVNSPIYTLGGDTVRIKDNVYDLTPETHQALSSTIYTGKNMKHILMTNNINDLGDTGIGDEKNQSAKFSFFRFTWKGC